MRSRATRTRRIVREQLKNWRACYDTLTARELEVFERVVAGKMNKEIAGELGAAERTIKAHRAEVMRKMGAASLAELYASRIDCRSEELRGQIHRL